MSSPTAILLVNVQKNFLIGENPVPDAAIVTSTISRLINKARSANPPPIIAWVRNCGGFGDPDQVDTDGWQLHSQAESPPEHIVDKTRNNPFDQGKLDKIIPTDALLYVVGMQSEYDVKSACNSARQRGNKVVLVASAHATFHQGEKLANWIQREVESELSAAGVQVMDEKDISFG